MELLVLDDTYHGMNKIYKRTCPKCQKDIIYKSNSALWLGNHKNSSCKSCATSGVNNAMFGKTGSLNPFFGKRHTTELRDKFRKDRTGVKLSPEHAAKVIMAGKKNIIQGNVYIFWLNKYGKEEADRRLERTKKKHSKNNSGSGNPMYNKPSPQGSGNGWSGWYKEWFFRSLRELKFVVELDKQNIEWQSAENQKYKVEYVDPMGKQRNYFPDFIVGKRIIECKPRKLWETPLVKAKSKAAKEKFELQNLLFELVDPGKFDENDFKKLVENGIVSLTQKYKQKYNENYNV